MVEASCLAFAPPFGIGILVDEAGALGEVEEAEDLEDAEGGNVSSQVKRDVIRV